MLLKKYIVKEKRLKKFIVWHKIIICYPSNNSIDRPQSPNTRRLTTFHYIGKEKLTKRKEHNPHIFSSYLFFLLFKISIFPSIFEAPLHKEISYYKRKFSCASRFEKRGGMLFSILHQLSVSFFLHCNIWIIKRK